MTLAGWIFFAVSWTLILGAAVYCFFRILKDDKSSPENK